MRNSVDAWASFWWKAFRAGSGVRALLNQLTAHIWSRIAPIFLGQFSNYASRGLRMYELSSGRFVRFSLPEDKRKPMRFLPKASGAMLATPIERELLAAGVIHSMVFGPTKRVERIVDASPVTKTVNVAGITGARR